MLVVFIILNVEAIIRIVIKFAVSIVIIAISIYLLDISFLLCALFIIVVLCSCIIVVLCSCITATTSDVLFIPTVIISVVIVVAIVIIVIIVVIIAIVVVNFIDFVFIIIASTQSHSGIATKILYSR